MKKMSKKATSAMGYHKAYLKADAASRNLNLAKFRKDDSSPESESSDDESGKKTKNVSAIVENSICCKYVYAQLCNSERR